MIRPVSGGCWGEAWLCLRLRTQGAFQWHGDDDPVSVETCSCAQTYSRVVFRPVYETDCEPAMRCIAPVRGRNAVCRRSLPCVRRVDGGTTGGALWPEGPFDRPLKPGLQKRLKGRIDWGGNHLGCPDRAEKGLQCGLSGDRVAWLATLCRGTEGGTASIGNERCAAGKSNPYLSRKIYLFRRRRLSQLEFIPKWRDFF